jgi:hypothetical protein
MAACSFTTANSLWIIGAGAARHQSITVTSNVIESYTGRACSWRSQTLLGHQSERPDSILSTQVISDAEVRLLVPTTRPRRVVDSLVIRF